MSMCPLSMAKQIQAHSIVHCWGMLSNCNTHTCSGRGSIYTLHTSSDTTLYLTQRSVINYQLNVLKYQHFIKQQFML